jgi:hypothetical protein
MRLHGCTKTADDRAAENSKDPWRACRNQCENCSLRIERASQFLHPTTGDVPSLLARYAVPAATTNRDARIGRMTL